eukprot:jgi/Psemu1/36304/gm1.36304_g
MGHSSSDSVTYLSLHAPTLQVNLFLRPRFFLFSFYDLHYGLLVPIRYTGQRPAYLSDQPIVFVMTRSPYGYEFDAQHIDKFTSYVTTYVQQVHNAVQSDFPLCLVSRQLLIYLSTLLHGHFLLYQTAVALICKSYFPIMWYYFNNPATNSFRSRSGGVCPSHDAPNLFLSLSGTTFHQPLWSPVLSLTNDQSILLSSLISPPFDHQANSSSRKRLFIPSVISN